MNAKADVQSPKGDTIKIFAIIAIMVSAIGGFYYYADHSLLLRVIGLCVAAGIVVALLLQTVLGQNIWQFAQDSKLEVRKVVWPTRQETIQTTLIVLVVVFIVALLLWGLDSALLAAVQSLTNH